VVNEGERQCFRSWINPHRLRRIWRIGVVLVALYILMHVTVGLVFYGTWPPWQVYVLPWLMIPALILQYRCGETRMVVRIDDRSIAYTRINGPTQNPRRVRVRLHWDEIDRIHLGNGSMLLSAGDRCIGLGHRLFPPERWDELYLLIQFHLEENFDLITPTPAQLRFERIQNRTKFQFALDIMLVTLIALIIVGAYVGFILISTQPGLPKWSAPVGAGCLLIVGITIMHIAQKQRKKRNLVNWRERNDVAHIGEGAAR
jgi:hypothetical protein